MNYTETAAALSPCGTYRYALTRAWQPDYRDTIVFLMLNPSTADGTDDDPTIRRCVGFADRWGYGRLLVLNLYAFRATDPAVMFAAEDPVGPANNGWIERETAGRLVVCAWGSASVPAGPKRRGSVAAGEGFDSRPAQVYHMCRRAGATLKCLGLTLDLHPRHPLYVRADAQLIDFGHPGPGQKPPPW